MTAVLAQSRAAMLAGEAQGRARGIALSLLVHAGLIVAIAFGVSWRSRAPEALQAELWAAVPQAAAARAVEPDPAPVAPPPAVATPTPRPAPPPQPDAQIAIEKARVEAKAREAAEREAQRVKLEADKLRQQQAADERAARQREAAEKLRQQQAADERAAQQQREVERKKNLERMLGQAGASGDAGAQGAAQQSSGPSASYAGMIVARLKRENNFGGAVAGNPKAEVEIRVGADGTIVGRRLLKSSGVPAWDDAVLRAIDKAGALPRDVDGRVQNPTLVVWGPRD